MEKVQRNSIDKKQNGLKYLKSDNHPPPLGQNKYRRMQLRKRKYMKVKWTGNEAVPAV